MSELIRVSNLCEKATEADREIDLAILRARSGKPWRWASSLNFEPQTVVTWDQYGPGAVGNPVCSLEDFTQSIDCALLLVPDGWFWRVGRTSVYQAWAGVHQTHPDHGEPNKNEFFFKRELWEPPSTPALALCNVALRAIAVVGTASPPAEVKTHTPRHDATGGE